MFPIISYGVSTGNAVKQKLASGNWQKGFRRKSLYPCSAINPKHLAKFKNECPYFCSNKQVRYARGFLGILENLTAKQTHFFINRVISNSSRRTYYRVRNGERALSPAEQQNIINILKECGVTFSIEFDSYFEDYYWSNTL